MFPEGRLLDFLIVGAVALIVVGPKDLPVLMRKVGQFMAKVRGMAAEFRASFDELARQSELDELRKEVQALRSGNPIDFVAGQATGGGVLGDIHTDLTGAHAEMTALTTPIHETPPTSPEPAPPEPTSESPPEPLPKASAS
jgi:sec-independent protein translocase protein TatB